MSTFVSKKARSPFIRFQPVELETRRQGAPQTAYPFQGLFGAAIPNNLKFTSAGNPNLDLVPLFEAQSLDDGRRKANCQAVSPFCDLHRYTRSLYIIRRARCSNSK